MDLIIIISSFYAVTAVTAQKMPYIFIDFDYINRMDIWKNRNTIRTQIATDDAVTINDKYPTTTTIDNNGATVGVFLCDNQKNENVYTTPNTAAYIPETLTYNQFTLEVIVKPTVNNVIFHGYIIGIEGTYDNIQGDSISYNAIYNKISEQPNTFFPSNFIQNGWMPISQFWDDTTNAIDITKFHHVIVTQNAVGLVTVYVNGVQYGSSYLAVGGAKNNIESHPAFHIKVCGNGDNIGFDGYVRAFGFYTESFTYLDAANACNAVNHMVECETASPTMPTVNTLSPTVNRLSPTVNTLSPTSTTLIDDRIELNWIAKEGQNCGDGYKDIDSSSIYYGKYCKQCPDDTAGTYGICEKCDTFKEPNHSRTECEYTQPWWLWLLQVIGSLAFLATICCGIYKYVNSKL
eukprot:425203_1